MAESGQEFTGKSVDEAIAEGLAKLGLRRDQVEVEVLSRGSRGIFGLGSEPARVRISRRAAPAASTVAPPPAATTPVSTPAEPAPAVSTTQPAPQAQEATPVPAAQEQEAAAPVKAAPQEEMGEDDLPYPSAQVVGDKELEAMAVEMLQRIIELMGFKGHIVSSWHVGEGDEREPYLLLDIRGEDLGALIGRRGETLASLQYLLRLMVNQRLRQWKNIVVDVEQYKERRVAQLTQLALRMAEQVAQSGRAVSLEPMPPNERRIVHLALRDHSTVYTQSSGEGDRRKVHIVAKG